MRILAILNRQQTFKELKVIQIQSQSFFELISLPSTHQQFDSSKFLRHHLFHESTYCILLLLQANTESNLVTVIFT